MAQDILFPISRLVGGSVHKLYGKTNKDGSPKLGKDGKQMMAVSFGVAIPKTQARWQDEWYQHQTLGLIKWGAEVEAVGKAATPTLYRAPTYAWKITDGDSLLPNKKGKIPAQQIGYPGHWVIWFSQGWVPPLYNADGTVEMPAEKFKLGYYIQVFGNVDFNKSDESPGVYMNPKVVALSGEGEVINVDIDATSVGFGGTALPEGATPVTPATTAFGASAPAPTPTPASAPAPATTPVTPNASFMEAPASGAPGAPAAPDAPTPPAGPQMTAKAGRVSYEAFIAKGWTDESLRANGYLV